MLIVLEGGEGSGKGVQARLLKYILESAGYVVLSIIEPGGTPVGAAIRNVLLNRIDLTPFGITEAFLFSASRAQQVREITRPALERGEIVISDRSFYSTFVYQGYARELPLRMLRTLTKIAVGKTTPDLVILLDLPPEIGLARKTKQDELNRLDKETLDFHRKVRKGYLALAKKDPALWHVIDATLSIEEIQLDITSVVLKALKNANL